MRDLSSNLTQLPPLSLYIHIPWCVKKCPYCDFNSHNQPTNGIPEELYIDALIKDLTNALPLIWGRTINTVFIGGGTPSLFSGKAINKLLQSVRSLTNLSPFAEITLEANPGATDELNLESYADSGVNRISFGIQSFNDAHLKTLGRIHNSNLAISAIRTAKQYFNNINLDLIYGLPKQTLAELTIDLGTALDFKVNHLSLYNLTIEPNTEFYKNIPSELPDNDLCYIMQDEIINKLTQAGYSRYEISAYALSNSTRSKHNLNYWEFGDYLGIGAGAHSKLTMHNRVIRQVRHKNPRNYMDLLRIDNIIDTTLNMSIDTKHTKSITPKTHLIENRVIEPKDLPFEFLLNSFRLLDGFNSQLFVERTGLSLNVILDKLLIAQREGFLTVCGTLIKPTNKGTDFLNDLLILFLE